jgi:hypothetical protein
LKEVDDMKKLLERKAELIKWMDEAEKEKNWSYYNLLLEELEIIFNKLSA